jgi:hypothetical protein
MYSVRPAASTSASPKPGSCLADTPTVEPAPELELLVEDVVDVVEGVDVEAGVEVVGLELPHAASASAPSSPIAAAVSLAPRA